MNAGAIEELFRDHFRTEPKFRVRAPGRVNLLGEHVDYNDGPVLPAAIDRAVYLAATEEPSGKLILYAVDLGEEVCIDLDHLDSKTCRNGGDLPVWTLYPVGVARSLRDEGLEVKGVRVAYASDVPIGAGLSSSAAVEVGFAALWQAIGGWQVERLRLAQLCQRAENEYVGVACGLMDQFASACGVEGHALYFDTCSLEWQAAPLPEGTALVIADSGVRRDLTTSAYNERRTACEQAVSILQEYLPDIRSLRDVKVTEFAAYNVMLPDVIRRRAEHVVKEIARVESALNALKREDKQAMGALMYAGHKSLRELYEVSTPELDALVDLSRDLTGCIGARLTGAGFGGCTINLVEAEMAREFIQGLKTGYLEQTGRQAQVYLCQARQGVTVEGSWG